MNEIEAAGDAVLGGTLAKAAEPAAGAVSADGHTDEAACLNCGTMLAGDYCHSCGQRRHVHRTIRAFLHDLLHGILHVEGKIWRTLPMLAWRPGELTRRYIDGQRARFVSPIALFLFSVFLMFAVVSTTGDLNPTFSNQSRQDVPEGVVAGETVTFRSSIPWIDQAFQRARQNPQLLFYKLKTNSYKWSWALIPLSLPFLWLLFPFSRRFRFYDHVVFVTYSLSFMSLLIVLGSALAYAGLGGIAAVLLLIPPVHIFRQLSGAYSLGTWGALWRTAALMMAAVMVLGVFALLIIAVGELG